MDAATTQRMTALAHANQIRIRRAHLKHEIRDGKTSIAEVLDDPAAQTATVLELLKAPHRMGPARARAFLRMIGASPMLKAADLTDRQRTQLLSLLDAAGY